MIRARKNVGRISFVGAGPGDPGLLTVRALQLLQQADVIFIDSDFPLDHVAISGRSADQIHTADGDSAQIAKDLLSHAHNGSVVARLIPGDPFTSNEIIKEALAVSRTSVPFDVVPGISPSGVATYAGIATGPNRTEADTRSLLADQIDWADLSSPSGTLVLTTTSEDLGKLAASLIEHGRPPSTTVCVTHGGTTVRQRSTVTTLETIDSAIAETDQPGGSVIVSFGESVDHKSKLSWWESRPLYGWRVLVPRTKEQAGVMSERLQMYGAITSEVPTIAVEPPRTPAQMERAVKGLVTGRYEWIIFTSTNAVRAIREKFAAFGLDARAFAGVKIACIGEATAEAIREFGITPELVPSGEQSSEGLLAEFAPYDKVLDPIDRVLLPRADIATETLAAGLRERGWEIDDVTAYRTVRAAPPPAQTREAIKGGGFDAVCFTSSSTVRNLVGIAGKPHARTIVACIGPQTAATAREFGLRVDVEPQVAQVPALIDALAAFAAEHKDIRQSLPQPSRRTRAAKGRATP